MSGEAGPAPFGLPERCTPAGAAFIRSALQALHPVSASHTHDVLVRASLQAATAQVMNALEVYFKRVCAHHQQRVGAPEAERFREQLQFLVRLLGHPVIDQRQQDELFALKRIRNAITHNEGLVDHRYFAHDPRVPVGQPLDVMDGYARAMFASMLTVLQVEYQIVPLDPDWTAPLTPEHTAEFAELFMLVYQNFAPTAEQEALIPQAGAQLAQVPYAFDLRVLRFAAPLRGHGLLWMLLEQDDESFTLSSFGEEQVAPFPSPEAAVTWLGGPAPDLAAWTLLEQNGRAALYCTPDGLTIRWPLEKR